MYADGEHNTENLQYQIKPHTIIYCEISQIGNTCMQILTWQRQKGDQFSQIQFQSYGTLHIGSYSDIE